jgi:hypothetical protein
MATRMTKRVRYEFDGLNRLVIVDPQDALQPRRVVEGTILIDGENRLVYRARAKPQPAGRPPGQDYLFDGAWRLTKDHQLGLALHQREQGGRQELFLKGALIEADESALTVSLTQHERDGTLTAQRASLSGRWQADDRNRLTFLVEKADGEADELVLDGAWSVDERHELRYEYQQRRTTRRRTGTHALRFSGTWDLPQASRLVYRLDAQGRSAFAFQASLQSRSLNAREGKLAYQVGIRLSAGRTRTRQVVLFGAWKLNRDLSVAFEVPYADGHRQAMTFTGAYAFRDRNTIAVALSDRRGKPLELCVTFSRKFLDDAELFLRLQRSVEDTQLLGGVRLRF